MHIDRFTIFYFVALIVSVILHEISHGVVALWFGDDTAKRAGRITLNPIPHIDPFGSIVLPGLAILVGAPFLAWAKPVPVSPNRLRNPRRDMLAVSLAGPATNFTLMGIAAIVARVAYQPNVTSDLVDVAWSFAVVNLFLGVFNLLPIPPLDGSSIIERLLPQHALAGWYRLRQYGMLLLLVLVFSVGTGRFFTPFLDHLRNFIVT
jgi:Zn-dependent protease